MLCSVIQSVLRSAAVLEPFGSRSRGDENTKATPASGPVSDLDAAVMRQYDGLADGQPEPVPGRVRLQRRLVTEEWLENALAVLRGDTRSLVFYRELQFLVVRDPSRDADRGARRRVFDRVVDQVGEDALHLARIHAYGRQA
jgi:hypothetical protein